MKKKIIRRFLEWLVRNDPLDLSPIVDFLLLTPLERKNQIINFIDTVRQPYLQSIKANLERLLQQGHSPEVDQLRDSQLIRVIQEINDNEIVKGQL